jgi:hypothetical protein
MSVGPFIKVVVLYVKMTLDFWIDSFRYQRHVISLFQGLVSLVFLQSRLWPILPIKSIFSRVEPFIKVVVMYVKITLVFGIASFRYRRHVISLFQGLVSLVFLQSRLRPILPTKSIFSRVGSFIKVVVLYVKITLVFGIASFRYWRHVISLFQGLVSLVFL